MHFHSEEYDRAIAAFQKLVKIYRWENQSKLMLGRCFFAKGMLDLALQELRNLPAGKELKALLYEIGLRYEKRNDMVGAKTAYRVIFAADIHYKDVRDRFETLSGSSSGTNIDMFRSKTMLGELDDKAQERYELIEEVGRGAMGLVYKAQDKVLEEVVALKILQDNLSKSPEAIMRFKAEARSARKLAHRHIVRIHDIGEESGRKYLSMEFIDGEDLKQMIRSKKEIGIDQTARYARQIADALDYAHEMGIIHRDVKPANVLIDEHKSGEGDGISGLRR